VLRNLAGLQDADVLADHEAQASTLRLVPLAALRLEGAYDLAHFQEFHRFIFQDIYSWAGEVRSVPLAKLDPPVAPALRWWGCARRPPGVRVVAGSCRVSLRALAGRTRSQCRERPDKYGRSAGRSRSSGSHDMVAGLHEPGGGIGIWIGPKSRLV
jgi:hypothetical protein